MRATLRAVLYAQLDKVADKVVADLDAIVADMKRRREQAERDQNEIRRTA